MLKTLIACIGLFVLGMVMFAIPTGTSAPEPVCAEPGTVSSGFVDEESGCPLTVESSEAILDYESDGLLQRAPIRAVGLLLAGLTALLTPVALLVAFVVGRSRSKKGQPAAAPMAPPSSY